MARTSDMARGRVSSSGLDYTADTEYHCYSSAAMAGETGGGGDWERPSPPGPINSISWVEPGGPNI